MFPPHCTLLKMGANFISPYKRLPRPIWAIFFIQVINRMGDFITPFLTLFLTISLGYDSASCGFFVMASVLSGILGTLLAGKVSDQLGRKPILLVGMGMSALLIGICGFISQGNFLPWILVGAGFFQGTLRPVISALITDHAENEQRKDAFALSYLGINLGVAIGPMIAGFLFSHYQSWLFWGDSLSTLVAMFLVLRFIPTHSKLKHSDEKIHHGSALGAFFQRPLVVIFCVLLMGINFMYSQITFALPLYTKQLFFESGAVAFGWLMSFNAVVVLFFTPLINHFNRRRNATKVMTLGVFFYAVGFLMMAFPLSFPLLFVSTFIWSLGEILLSINTGAHLASHTPKNLRGQFQSYREFMTSLGRLASPLAFGAVISAYGTEVCWMIVGIIGLFVCIGFLGLDKAEARSLRVAQ